MLAIEAYSVARAVQEKVIDLRIKDRASRGELSLVMNYFISDEKKAKLEMDGFVIRFDSMFEKTQISWSKPVILSKEK